MNRTLLLPLLLLAACGGDAKKPAAPAPGPAAAKSIALKVDGMS